MSAYRGCDCPTGYPICACCEGLTGVPLYRRSAWLSSLCGWPGPIADDDLVVSVLAQYGHPIPCDFPPTWPWPALPDDPGGLARAVPPASPGGSPDGCGCGGG
jgi:hypothetical protein